MGDFEEMLNKAKEETSKNLLNEIKGLTVLSDDEINDIALTGLDKTNLLDLILILQDGSMTNIEKNNVIKELADTSVVIINLLGKIL